MKTCEVGSSVRSQDHGWMRVGGGMVGLLVASGLVAAAATGEMEVTLQVTASGQASIGTFVSDECEMRFTARLLFRPDPVTGRYGDPVEETYTMTATGGGHVMDIESWTYSALLPPPGTVKLSYDPGEGRAVVGWSYMDDHILSTPEGGQGSERLARTGIKIAEDNIIMQPEAGEVRFTPGSEEFTASGSVRGEHSDVLGHAEMTATYTVTREGEELEAVILTPIGYQGWMPSAGPNQTTPGTNPVVVFAELRSKGTTGPPRVRKARFRFELLQGSKEPGLCLNAPGPATATAAFDLQFGGAKGIAPTALNQRYETEDLTTSSSAIVLCYDYGASSRVGVTAITDTGREIRAHVEGKPDFGWLSLPQDDNGNRIADVWEREQGTWGEVQDPAWDESDLPDDHEVNGDGIGLYEKYRGFQFGREHERLQARRKHVFVHDPDGLVHLNLGSVMSFQKASLLRVRFVEGDTWTGPGTAGSGRRIVNFNTSGYGHAVDQHALHVRLVNSRTPVLADDFQDYCKAKYGTALDRDISSYFGYTYHDMTGGTWAESPRTTFVIELYPWVIERMSREYVRYHTFALPDFQGFDASTDDEKQEMREKLDRLAEEHIQTFSGDWEEQNILYLLAGTSHELGHGVGIDELRPPHHGGPWSCYMRYLDWDCPPDSKDRMELKARWRHSLNRPQEFCLDSSGTVSGKGCYEQIHVTDRRSGGGSLRGMENVAATPAIGTNQWVSKGAPGAELRVEAVLDWEDLLGGDPLRFTVRLSSVAAMEAWSRALDDLGVLAMPPMFPVITDDWPDGLQLELVRLEPGGGQSVVLPLGSWAVLRREVPSNPAFWEHRLGVRTREFLTDPENAPLAAGHYVLSVGWDGRGRVEGGLLPASGLLEGGELHFTVGTAVDDRQRAVGKRRLAFQAWDRGRFDVAWQRGEEALALAPDEVGREAIESIFVVAASHLQLGDLHGVVRALRSLGQLDAWGEHPELRMAGRMWEDAVLPSLRMDDPPGPGGPGRVRVYGHVDQTYAVQVSEDLQTWTVVDQRWVRETPYVVSDPDGGVGETTRFFRVLWLP